MATEQWRGGMADEPKKPWKEKKTPPTHRSDGRKHTPKSSDPKIGEITKSTGKPKRHSKGKRNAKVDQSNWRHKLQQARIKFDDVAKQVFLDTYRVNGNLKMRAADASGVALQTVNEHLKNDRDFAAAFDEATAGWRDNVVNKAIIEIALEGIQVTKFDKDGKVLEERRDHPVKLLEMELKRVDHSYRENATLDIIAGGGVLIAPAHMTPTDWMNAQEEKNKTRMNPMLEHEPGETLEGAKIPETQKVIRG